MTAEDFLEASHKLRVQQQAIKEEEEDKADESEVEELNNLRQASVCWFLKANLLLSAWKAVKEDFKNKGKPKIIGGADLNVTMMWSQNSKEPIDNNGTTVPEFQLLTRYTLDIIIIETGR